MAKSSVVNNSPVRLPDSSNRTIVIGRTGSGKTQAALWLLSTQNIHEMPWVLVDFKGDDSINSIDKAQYIGYETVPSKPGIYILRPKPGEESELDGWLWRVWEHENIGLFFDEVFMLGQDSQAFNTILMQGRSKNVPVIACTQQPVNISTYCFSEANYYMLFDLTVRRHRTKVAGEIPIDPDYQLPDYCFFLYDVNRKSLSKMAPVPDASITLTNISNKIPVVRKFI